jgi:hypothetical protein
MGRTREQNDEACPRSQRGQRSPEKQKVTYGQHLRKFQPGAKAHTVRLPCHGHLWRPSCCLQRVQAMGLTVLRARREVQLPSLIPELLSRTSGVEERKVMKVSTFAFCSTLMFAKIVPRNLPKSGAEHLNVSIVTTGSVMGQLRRL